MSSNLAVNRYAVGSHGRIKPSADEWHMVVGMAIGINRDLQADEKLQARVPEALKALSMAVDLLVAPYLKMQRELSGADADKTQSGRLTATFNNSLPKIGIMAMLLADVAEDVRPLFSEGEQNRLKALGSFLNTMAMREASGVGREEKCQEVLRYGRKLSL